MGKRGAKETGGVGAASAGEGEKKIRNSKWQIAGQKRREKFRNGI